MIAADTSSLVEFLKGNVGRDVDLIGVSLDEKNLIIPPIVLAEIISDPKLSNEIKETLQSIPSFSIKDGFWVRSGKLRATLLGKGRKSKLGDALIAQFCIDYNLPLISRDSDFAVYAKNSPLKLI